MLRLARDGQRGSIPVCTVGEYQHGDLVQLTLRPISLVLVVLSLAGTACSRTVGEEELREALESEGSRLATELEVGDCFERPEGLETQIGVEQLIVVTLASCDDPHGAEVFATLEHPAGPSAPYPGEFALGLDALQQCGDEFGGFIGGPDIDPLLDILVVTPTSANWVDDFRRIVCSVYRLDGADMVGSARGSGSCEPEADEGTTILMEDFEDGATVGDKTGTSDRPSGIGLLSRGSGVAYECRLFPLEGTVELAVIVEEAPGTILDNRGDQARREGDIFLRVGQTGRLQFTLAPRAGVNPTLQVLVSSRTSLTDGLCHTLAISFGSGGVELYVDGELEGSHRHTGSRFPNLVAVGDWPEDSAEFGIVGEIRALRTSTAQSDITFTSCPD